MYGLGWEALLFLSSNEKTLHCDLGCSGVSTSAKASIPLFPLLWWNTPAQGWSSRVMNTTYTESGSKSRGVDCDNEELIGCRRRWGEEIDATSMPPFYLSRGPLLFIHGLRCGSEQRLFRERIQLRSRFRERKRTLLQYYTVFGWAQWGGGHGKCYGQHTEVLDVQDGSGTACARYAMQEGINRAMRGRTWHHGTLQPSVLTISQLVHKARIAGVRVKQVTVYARADTRNHQFPLFRAFSTRVTWGRNLTCSKLYRS